MSKVARSRRGFTFVELLAVVLVLAVLAAVAIPIYMNSRRSSAARTCIANIGTIARATSSFATRNGRWPTLAELNGAPEGLEATLLCPLDRTAAYSLTDGAGAAYTSTTAAPHTGAIQVRCANSAAHANATGTAGTNWQHPLPAIPGEPAGL